MKIYQYLNLKYLILQSNLLLKDSNLTFLIVLRWIFDKTYLVIYSALNIYHAL